MREPEGSLEKWESPETLIIPPQTSSRDINIGQKGISKEEETTAFSSITLGLCDNCKWCCTCFSARGVIDPCPLCGADISHIPMTLDEICRIRYDDDEKQVITLEFGRKELLKSSTASG